MKRQRASRTAHLLADMATTIVSIVYSFQSFHDQQSLAHASRTFLSISQLPTSSPFELFCHAIRPKWIPTPLPKSLTSCRPKQLRVDEWNVHALRELVRFSSVRNLTLSIVAMYRPHGIDSLRTWGHVHSLTLIPFQGEASPQLDRVPEHWPLHTFRYNGYLSPFTRFDHIAKFHGASLTTLELGTLDLNSEQLTDALSPCTRLRHLTVKIKQAPSLWTAAFPSTLEWLCLRISNQSEERPNLECLAHCSRLHTFVFEPGTLPRGDLFNGLLSWTCPLRVLSLLDSSVRKPPLGWQIYRHFPTLEGYSVNYQHYAASHFIDGDYNLDPP